MMLWSFILAFVAWTMLCAAMSRPYNELFSQTRIKPHPLVLRIIGWLLLVASLSCSVTKWGGSVGFAAWWILLAVSAFSFITMRSYWPSRILTVAGTILVLGSFYSYFSL
ncbi:DUF3325 domain-containing protein [Aquirhabdus parva]|uniref:DUF3325 domain-containing protein n=1 Tax=Aquirhabdus parva TaxID=2283318 RepID=A0A345P4I2_9GAMM|nr:DUF3325 domain-containing protein [Aquirhabdus parva]AXI02191.1 DUF3325 domain-containing protein [Aquirhabdus parva]